MGFSELLVLAVLALLITGPKELPKMLKTLGQWAGRARRMASDLRAQSGIDEVLHAEGLSESIVELRKLARGELDHVVRAASFDAASGDRASPDTVEIVRDREYPAGGPDAYGAIPDTAILYTETFPRSKLADDAFYVMGDASLPLPTAPESLVMGEVPRSDTRPLPSMPPEFDDALRATAAESKPEILIAPADPVIE